MQVTEAGRSVFRLLSGAERVWLLTAGVATAAVLIAMSIRTGSPLDGPLDVPWWALAVGFYLAEVAVVHLRFGKDAHSFSMSEIPLVVGLFFVGPLELIGAQLVGTAVALTIHRRQPPVKLAFNLAQFAFQAGIAVLVFRAYIDLGDPVGPAGWAAAMIAALAALLAADLLINTAIRLNGGMIQASEVFEVFGMSALAAIMNTALALSAVTMLWSHPEAVWLVAAPSLVFFLAYRAYVSQRAERTRLNTLYEITRELHGLPQLETALATAAARACSMFDAEFTEIYLFPNGRGGTPYRTAAGPGSRREVMRSVDLEPQNAMWRPVVESGQALLLAGLDEPLPSSSPDAPHVTDAMAAPLVDGGTAVGAVVVANRLGDISRFDRQDLETLQTLAAQISVSVRNSHLEDSLARVTELKEEQERLIHSKNQFVASISHELRTPLTAVVGLSQELASGHQSLTEEERKELVGVIAEQSIELSSIVDDLLVAARADSGTLPVHITAVDVTQELQVVVGHLDSPDEIPVQGSSSTTWADPLRLRQILRNLLTNADRYGGESISVELTDRGPHVSIAVKDNGPGVPPEHEESIFEAYERVGGAETQPASVGLGLAVARQLSRLMGGDVTYQRNDGHTIFELTLPAVGSVNSLQTPPS